MSSGDAKVSKDMIKQYLCCFHGSWKSFRGTRRHALENLSTVTRMQVLPSDAGKSVTKSTSRCAHGHRGMGRGRNFPDGKWWGVFAVAHSRDPLTYLLMSLAIPGHQKQSFISERV